MKNSAKFRFTIYAFGFAGAVLFTFLLLREGAASVGEAIAKAGWGILAVACYHVVVPIVLDAFAWRVLFPPAHRPSWRTLLWMRWIGESISNLVPSAAVGGDLVRARLVTIAGTPLPVSAATVIVDITLGVVTQIGFTLLGLVLLVEVTGRTSFIRPTLVGALIAAAAATGFYLAQRRGLFGFLSAIIARLAQAKEWSSLLERGENLDQKVRELYSRRAGILACFGLTIVSLIASSGEIFIALSVLGANPTFLNALILQSMAMTVKSAAFAVPGQLGVQESGYVILGNILGIPGETSFAISLITRFRDLLIGIPGLVAWQLIEGRRLLRPRP